LVKILFYPVERAAGGKVTGKNKNIYLKLNGGNKLAGKRLPKHFATGGRLYLLGAVGFYGAYALTGFFKGKSRCQRKYQGTNRKKKSRGHYVLSHGREVCWLDESTLLYVTVFIKNV
jgi:hypothetical protein